MSFWKTREFDEENYLGEVKIGLEVLLERPEEWAVNGKFGLEALEFEDVEITERFVFVQGKWIPSSD